MLEQAGGIIPCFFLCACGKKQRKSDTAMAGYSRDGGHIVPLDKENGKRAKEPEVALGSFHKITSGISLDG